MKTYQILIEQQSRKRRKKKQNKKLPNPSTLSNLSNNSRTSYDRAGTCYTVVRLRQCEQQFLQQQENTYHNFCSVASLFIIGDVSWALLKPFVCWFDAGDVGAIMYHISCNVMSCHLSLQSEHKISTFTERVHSARKRTTKNLFSLFTSSLNNNQLKTIN